MGIEKPKSKRKEDSQLQADRVEIIYYTDPLCCWSWAMVPQLEKFRSAFGDQINWRYCMGGLLPGWKNYHDEINDVSRPIQMGPVWMHAAQVSGVAMNSEIWMKDPPASSYPACIAVKCAFFQSTEAGEKYLMLLREALMLHGKNIAKEEVLLEVANGLSKDPVTSFDEKEFLKNMKNDNGLEDFRKDLKEIQYRNIKRFPTLVMKTASARGIIITGYRPYEMLAESMQQLLKL